MAIKTLRNKQHNTVLLAMVYAPDCSILAEHMATAFYDNNNGLASIPIMIPTDHPSPTSSTLRVSYYINIEPGKNNEEFFSQARNGTAETMKELITIHNINLSPAISLDYDILNDMATNLPHCRAILPNFSKGPSSVTYTAIFDNNFEIPPNSPPPQSPPTSVVWQPFPSTVPSQPTAHPHHMSPPTNMLHLHNHPINLAQAPPSNA